MLAPSLRGCASSSPSAAREADGVQQSVRPCTGDSSVPRRGLSGCRCCRFKPRAPKSIQCKQGSSPGGLLPAGSRGRGWKQTGERFLEPGRNLSALGVKVVQLAGQVCLSTNRTRHGRNWLLSLTPSGPWLFTKPHAPLHPSNGNPSKAQEGTSGRLSCSL